MNYHINNIDCDVKTLNDNNDFSNKKKFCAIKKNLFQNYLTK